MRIFGLIQASSWNTTAAVYQERAETNTAWAPMAEFVRQVTASRYAVGLHPGNSMATLLIAQTRLFKWKREVLEVKFVTTTQRFQFDFWEEPRAEPHWSREYGPGEAFALLEKLLRTKRWFLDGADPQGH